MYSISDAIRTATAVRRRVRPRVSTSPSPPAVSAGVNYARQSCRNVLARVTTTRRRPSIGDDNTEKSSFRCFRVFALAHELKNRYEKEASRKVHGTLPW